MSRALLPAFRAARLALTAATTLTLAARAQAQQAPAPRFVATVAPVQAQAQVTREMALDSASHYRRAAGGQRALGAALGLLGGAGAAASYAGWAGSGRMGMNGGQAVAMTAGVAAVVVGWERWRHANQSEVRARRWAAEAAASRQ
jgi:hypothetical protein